MRLLLVVVILLAGVVCAIAVWLRRRRSWRTFDYRDDEPLDSVDPPVPAPRDGRSTVKASPTSATGVEPPGTPGTHLDEDVQFTVYRPEEVLPERWYTLLVFGHKTQLVEDSAGRLVDPVAEVERDAARRLQDEEASFSRLTSDTAAPIPRGAELTVAVDVPDVAFNPVSRTFIWAEYAHGEEFRFRASSAGPPIRRGLVTVYLGPLVIAVIPIALKVVEGAVAEPATVPASAPRYRQIFPSYSHADSTIVRRVKDAAEVLGDRYLLDVIAIRSGEAWGPKIMDLIREADVFQLFWSTHSMRSEHVSREWTYALSLDRPEFVRPLYWEHPRPEDADLGLPPPELDAIHFAFLSSRAVAPPQEPDTHDDLRERIEEAVRETPLSLEYRHGAELGSRAGCLSRVAALVVGVGVVAAVGALIALLVR